MKYELEINYRRVAHILTTSHKRNGLNDLDLLQMATEKLRKRNNI